MHPAAFLQLALKAIENAAAVLPVAWQGFAQQAAAMALTALWQGAAVAVGLAICVRFAPRSSAAHRFGLWAWGFGAVIGLEFLPLLWRILAAPAAGANAAAMSAAASPSTARPWFELDVRWGLAIAVLWIAASLYRAADLAHHSLRLRRLWKRATPVGLPVELDERLVPLAGALRQKGRHAAQICTTGDLERPGVIGFFSPRILIPDWLFVRLTHGELEQIVLHEAEHLRRADDWTNLLQKLCLVLFPLNPALAWIERRLCREREMACDDGVIRITRAPRAYAACLTSLAERGLHRRTEALSLGLWQRRPELAHRVHSVLRRKNSPHPAAARAALAAIGCGLVFGAVELARCPQLFAFVEPQTAVAAQKRAPVEARNVPPKLEDAHRARVRSAARIHAPVLSAQETRREMRRETHMDAEIRVTAGAAGIRAVDTSARMRSGQPALEPALRASSLRASGLRVSNRRPMAEPAQAIAGPASEAAIHAELLKAEPRAATPRTQKPVPTPALAPTEEQSWIVFTAWEQVRIPSGSPASDGEAPGNGPDAGAKAVAAVSKRKPQTRTSTLSTRQIMVTRLLFRIYRSDPAQKLPAGAVVEDGWLVIQL
ncbi:MAG: M56 family metallopeptidase [Terracidiphilus sp.]